jgi:hypothetical protein
MTAPSHHDGLPTNARDQRGLPIGAGTSQSMTAVTDMQTAAGPQPCPPERPHTSENPPVGWPSGEPQ